MKYRKILGCVASFLFLAAEANSQQLTPAVSSTFSQAVSLFRQFPSSCECKESSLNALFDTSGEVSLQLENSYSFKGNIISHNKPNPFAETINVRLLDFPDATLTVSRIRQENGVTSYTGHMLSFGSEDAIVLYHKNKKYYFVKTEQRLVLTE